MERPVATVNGAPIDRKALDAAMQSLAREEFHCDLDGVPDASLAELRRTALERLLARELIFQAALAEGYVASAEDVEAETARILRLMGSPAAFWERLAERGMDEAAFRRMVRKDVTVDGFTAQRLEAVPEPDEPAIAAFYRAHPEKLRSPERVRVSHILVEAADGDFDAAMQRALVLRDKTREEDFAELARAHSACPSAPGGGDLGFIRHADVDPTFADAAFSQIPGEVGDPVRTPFGVHLIKVVSREISSPPTLDEARPRIVRFLRQAEGSRRLADWVAGLRRSAEIVIAST